MDYIYSPDDIKLNYLTKYRVDPGLTAMSVVFGIKHPDGTTLGQTTLPIPITSTAAMTTQVYSGSLLLTGLNLKEQVCYNAFRYMIYSGYSGSFYQESEFFVPISKTISAIPPSSGSGGGVGTLQQVTDLGATTNHTITAAGLTLGSANLSYTAGVVKSTKGFWASGAGNNVLADNDIYSNYSNDNSQTGIYFHDGTIPAGASFLYNRDTKRFLINPEYGTANAGTTLYGQALVKSGDLQVSGSLSVQGRIRQGGNRLFINYAGAVQDQFLCFSTTGNPQAYVLQWVDNNKRFAFSNPLAVSGKFTARGEAEVSGSLYVTGSVKVGSAYTLPKVDGSNNQILKTNGAGVLSWATNTSGAISIAVALYPNTRVGDFSWHATDDYLTEATNAITEKFTYIYLDMPSNATAITLNGWATITIP